MQQRDELPRFNNATQAFVKPGQFCLGQVIDRNDSTCQMQKNVGELQESIKLSEESR